MPVACSTEALRVGETSARDVARAADALLSNEGIVSSFEHASRSQRDVRGHSRVTHADKMHAKSGYDSVRLEGGTMTAARLTTIGIALASVTILAQTPKQPDWKALEDETMRHYQA